MSPKKKTLTRVTLRAVVQSEILPDRLADIRFLAYEKADDYARMSRQRAMRHGVECVIAERTENTVTLNVKCYTFDPSGIRDVEAATRTEFPTGARKVVVDLDG